MEMQYYIETNSFLKPKVKYVPVWVTIILSIVTLGIYIPYWFVTRAKELNRMAGKKVISRKIPVLIFILYCMSNLILLIGPYFINEIAMMLYEYIDILITYAGIICIVHYSFVIRKVLNHESMKTAFTLIFNIWYLQFYINKIYH